MIVYFDTSAFVPLVIDEPGGAICAQLWDDADAVATSRLLYVEAAAALAHALRRRRIGQRTHHAAMARLDDMWRELHVVEIDQELATFAASVAHRGGLRGYDSVHCASAMLLDAPDLVFATGNRKLLKACAALGLATASTGIVMN
jgi:predicted nucleic acid-binding protein